jgi:EpsI family protein
LAGDGVTTSHRLGVLTVMTLAGVVCLRAGTAEERVPPHRPLSEIPFTLDGWQGHPLPPFDPATAAVLRADEYISRSYVRRAGGTADLYIGYYERQRQGDTIHSPMNCLPGAGWQPLTIGRTEIAVADRSISANRYIVQKGLDTRLVVYWYQSHGRAVASEYWSRAYLALDALRLHRTDGAIVRVIAPIRDGQAAADRDATDFVQALVPVLGQHLPD